MSTVSIIRCSGTGHAPKLAEAVANGAASVTGAKRNLVAIKSDNLKPANTMVEGGKIAGKAALFEF